MTPIQDKYIVEYPDGVRVKLHYAPGGKPAVVAVVLNRGVLLAHFYVVNPEPYVDGNTWHSVMCIQLCDGVYQKAMGVIQQ